MRQIVRVLIFAAICYLFVLMFEQAWAASEPQIKTQYEGVQLDWRNANLTGVRMNEATWLNGKFCKAPTIGN